MTSCKVTKSNLNTCAATLKCKILKVLGAHPKVLHNKGHHEHFDNMCTPDILYTKHLNKHHSVSWKCHEINHKYYVTNVLYRVNISFKQKSIDPILIETKPKSKNKKEAVCYSNKFVKISTKKKKKITKQGLERK